jgi:putative transcriptional regulator
VIKRLLDEALAAKGKTRYWLARRTGISEQNLGKIARGETTSVEFDTLGIICEKLECQPGDLLRYVREKSEDSGAGSDNSPDNNNQSAEKIRTKKGTKRG